PLRIADGEPQCHAQESVAAPGRAGSDDARPGGYPIPAVPRTPDALTTRRGVRGGQLDAHLVRLRQLPGAALSHVQGPRWHLFSVRSAMGHLLLRRGDNPAVGT